MKTITQFNDQYPTMVDGLRALNDIRPKSTISYLAYRGWVQKSRDMSPANRILLFIKGVLPSLRTNAQG